MLVAAGVDVNAVEHEAEDGWRNTALDCCSSRPEIAAYLRAVAPNTDQCGTSSIRGAMVTYRVLDTEAGGTAAFEIENLGVTRGGCARLLRKIPGVTASLIGQRRGIEWATGVAGSSRALARARSAP